MKERFEKGKELLCTPVAAAAQEQNSSSTTSKRTEDHYVFGAPEIDLIIVSNGQWKEGGKNLCGGGDYSNKSIEERVDLNIQAIENYQQCTNKTVVFRTAGFRDNTANKGLDRDLMLRMNKQSMDNIDRLRRNDSRSFHAPKLTYVNWGDAVLPRSDGPDRINGDHVAHYDLEARMVLLQMVTNHLMDIGFFQQEQEDNFNLAAT